MKFIFPRITTYLTGLVIVVTIATAYSLATPGLDQESLVSPWEFAVGIVLGHLLGTIRIAGKNRTHAAVEDAQTVTLYVGNLAYRTTQNEVRDLFQRYGKVQSVRIMVDRVTQKSRGYGFVVLEQNAGRKALKELNNRDFNGRTLRVSEANERDEDKQNAA
jgi:RNA recognition motif-containing protein